MSRFNKGKKKKMPELSTASLPDIVFMLLFFFMVTSIPKKDEAKVNFKVPKGTEGVKLERQNKEIYYYVGKPQSADYGTDYRVQVDDQIVPDMMSIRVYLHNRRASDLKDVWETKVVNNFKVDQDASMRIVKKIHEELREEDALKVAYLIKDEQRKD